MAFLFQNTQRKKYDKHETHTDEITGLAHDPFIRGGSKFTKEMERNSPDDFKSLFKNVPVSSIYFKTRFNLDLSRIWGKLLVLLDKYERPYHYTTKRIATQK